MATKTRPGSKAASNTGSPRPKKTLGFLPEALRLVPDATIVVSAAGEILDANELAERLFGYAKNELHGQMVEALIPACARRRHQRHRAGFNSSPSKRSMGRGVELSGVRKDGSEFSADCSLIPVQIQNETLMVVAIRDLTEREQAEEALRESESRLRETMDGMLEGCQIIGFDWRYLYVNDAVARHGRRAKEDLLGHTMMEMYPGIEETEMFGYLRRCMEQRLPHRMENEFAYPDGDRGWFELSIQPVSEGIFILSLDITERKQAEEALRRQREEQQIILDSVPALIFYKDRENRFLRVNRALVEVSGIPKEAWEGGSAFDLFPKHAEDYWRDDKAVMESGQARRDIIEPMETPGGTRWLRTDKIPYRDADGQIIGIIGFSADITEQKRAEEALQHAREELEGKVERKMQHGESYGLTFREMTVLHLVADGQADKEIALALAISPYTVSKHVASVLLKMNANCRTEAGVRAVREGLVG